MTDLGDRPVTLLISEEAIIEKIASLALSLDKKFHGQEIVVIMILKGSLCFVSDLIRCLKTPFTLEAISCQSYGMKGDKRGDLTIRGLEELSIKDKHILLVDDIFDTGATLHSVMNSLLSMQPQSITSAVLLAKPSKQLAPVSPDYVLFSIDDHFVIGYGLDFKERYRGLRGIYKFS